VVTGAAEAEPLMEVFHRGPVTSSDHSRTFISASTPRSHHRRHACSPSFPDAVPRCRHSSSTRRACGDEEEEDEEGHGKQQHRQRPRQEKKAESASVGPVTHSQHSAQSTVQERKRTVAIKAYTQEIFNAAHALLPTSVIFFCRTTRPNTYGLTTNHLPDSLHPRHSTRPQLQAVVLLHVPPFMTHLLLTCFTLACTAASTPCSCRTTRPALLHAMISYTLYTHKH
jgi:hypothetical protein